MIATLGALGANITVGDHPKLAGLDIDTVWSTAVAIVVVMVLVVLVRRDIKSRSATSPPTRLQSMWELAVEAVQTQVDNTIGAPGASIVPLAISLFVFILVCNVFEVVGLGSHYEFLAPPTGDINLPLALALFVIVWVHIASIRARGIGGYVKHYLTQPFPIYLMPFNFFINLVEEIAKPITLALRLFGNLLSGGLMLSLIAALGGWTLFHAPVGDVFVLFLDPVWKVFDLFIGLIQAFIFALLTLLYFDVAMSQPAH